MKIEVPYESSGQELGETRIAMGKKLMQYVEDLINTKECKKLDKFYVLVHAKPWPNKPNFIKQKIFVTTQKPPMMLSCMLFGVDNREGKLTLEWALPGDWPVWSVGGTVEPVPETIASLNELGKLCPLERNVVYN